MRRHTLTRQFVERVNDLMEDERSWTFRDAALVVLTTLVAGFGLALWLGDEILKLTTG